MKTWKNEMLIKQGNQLVDGSYSLPLDSLRLLNLILSKVDNDQAFEQSEYRVHVSEFIEAFSIDKKGAYGRIEQAAITLASTPITVYDSSLGKRGWRKYAWFSLIEYNDNNDSCIQAIFSELVRPFLYEIKSNFTLINLNEISKLESTFAWRLYGWLCRIKNLNKHKKNGGHEVEFDVDWMKEKVGLTGYYSEYKELKRRVIEPAVSQINSNTSFSLSYEQIKSGRNVVSLRFFFIENNKLKNSIVSVVRPRLPRRPHVLKGSDAEGKWARACIKLLIEHQHELKKIDKKLTLADLRKLIEYYKIIGDKITAESVQRAIDNRTKK